MDTECKSLRIKRSDFETGPQNPRSVRQVFTEDVENPRHVVDRAETNNTGYRNPMLDEQLWPGGEVLYSVDEQMSKYTVIFQSVICEKFGPNYVTIGPTRNTSLL